MYDKDGDEIFQHYGPHIFHTSNPEVINFVLRFAEWEGYCNRPLAMTDKGAARLPISIETMADLNHWHLSKVVGCSIDEEDIYENIIKGYSYKQWGETPSKEVLDRIPKTNMMGGSYFGDVFEGLPKKGFTDFLENMLDHENIEVILGADVRIVEEPIRGAVIWTGPIDEYPGFEYEIKWYGTKFVREDGKGREYLTAVYNWNRLDKPFTRSTKMKLLTKCSSEDILYEYPIASLDKHYAVLDEKMKENTSKWLERLETANIYFCGRSATASYLDMDDVIEQSIKIVKKVQKSIYK